MQEATETLSPAETRPAIPHELERLSAAIEVLESRLTEFEEKLKPILGASVPEPVTPEGKAAQTCDVANLIVDLRLRIQTVIQGFLRLKNRIEL